MSTCFFIGHRETGDDILPRFTEAVERHITEYGVTEFVVGQYGDFDRLAARAVRKAKESSMEVVLTLLLPYYVPSASSRPALEGYDGTFYPPGLERVPKRLAILLANRYMVDHSGFLIAYAWHPASNARELLSYAKKREARGLLRIENLAEGDL